MSINMGIIKIEVNFVEAVKAIEEFKKNRIQAFETFTNELKEAVAKAVNTLLQTEMPL